MGSGDTSGMGRARADREGTVREAFVVLADTMVAEYDVVDLLDRLLGFLLELLPVDAAGIVLGEARHDLRVVSASSDAAELMELLELQSDEGPGLDCFESTAPVSIADLTGEAGRWPRFVAAAADWGRYRALHALPLRLRGQAIGALTLFLRDPGSLPPADLSLGQALADVATIGILQQRAIHRAEVVTEQLQSALTSRMVIEQAKGVLSQQFGESVAAAFERLRHYARSRNGKLTTVAGQVVRREIGMAGFTAPHQGRNGG
jgi:hypothetical protein